MNNFNLTNYLSKNRLIEAIELTRLYPKNPDKIAQKVADHFTLYDDLDLIYSVQPGSLKMDSRGAYFDLDTKAGPNTPGEDWEDINGFGIENYLGDYAGGSFIIRSEEGLDEDFFVIRNLANRNEKVGMVTDEEEIIFSSSERKDFPGFEGTMDALDNLKIREATPGMDTDKMIKTYNIGKDSRLVFVGDNKTYYVKNITPDRKSVFVTIDGSTTFKKPLSKVTKVDGKMVEEIKSNKMTKKELKEMIRQNILNELAEEITEDTNIQVDDSDGKLAPLYSDFYEGLEEAEEEVTDVEKVDINVDEPAAPAEPTLTDTEKEIQDHLNQALYAAQELGNESTAEDKEKLIQQIGNTIKFFTSDFVVKEDLKPEDIIGKLTGKELDLKKLEDATKKAMGGDSTDLTMLLAGVFEGKEEYYRDAEKDDAAHIKYLEKDMEDDKKSSMNESLEILKMKKLAGLLTEGEYAKALLKENEDSEVDMYGDPYVAANYVYQYNKQFDPFEPQDKKRNPPKLRENIEQDILDFWGTLQDDAAQSDGEYKAKWDTQFFIEQYPEYKGKEEEINNIVKKYKI